MVGAPGHGRVVGADVAGGVVRAWRVARGGHPGDAGDRRRRGVGRAGWPGAAARGPHDRGARHRCAEAALPARHRHGHQGLVPAVQRAGRGLRPRGPDHFRGARRRRVGRERPEGVDLGRAGRGPRDVARADEPGCAEASGHLVLRVRHEPARRRGATAQGDDGPRAVQRGVPRGCARARRRRHRRDQQRVGGREHDALVRAGGSGRGCGRRWRVRRDAGDQGGRAGSQGLRVRAAARQAVGPLAKASV